MADTRLTWFNIKEHIRKFIWIYIAVIAVVLVVGNLVWISTTPRVPEDQRVLVYLADAWSDPAPLSGIAQQALEAVRREDPSIREVAFESLMYADPEQDYTGVMLLMTRLAVGEGDVYFAGEKAAEALVNAGACLALDDDWAGGWMKDSGLEPFYAEITDEETGETRRFMAGLKLDSLTALRDLQAFDNAGACVMIADNGQNIASSMAAVEAIVAALKGAAA